ncbi:MerR family transcriptional regulator [Paenibacillus prosopidis]|uniref:Uncharacterized protein n=1 Tax=Paenibacillus prosopidis TaxID=630520 RepID=A0A368VLR5_9BACL|nr:MerR family transcriptional regulator [Paenibacillus prosopidis]RCW41636.1 hypothetical protein DFP97_12272 [Paenibacillus prosopidis]
MSQFDSDRVSIVTPDERERREQMRERISVVFQEDTLYRLLEDKGWTDRIFEGELLSLKEGESYNTENTVEILDLKGQQDIRNVFRVLKHYVRPDESTGHHRFDYKAIVRLRMIFLLKKDYTLPSLEKVLTLTKPGGTVNQDTNEAVLQALEENGRKFDLVAQFIKQLAENLGTQNKMLELQSKDDVLKNKIDEQIQLIKEIAAARDPVLERNNDLTKWITRCRIESELTKEAIDLWSKKPAKERKIKTGLFQSSEDINKRDSFIQEYKSKHIEDRLRNEIMP